MAREERPAVDRCGAGVSPAVAGASRSRARAGCLRDSGRDARTTIFSKNRGNELKDLLKTKGVRLCCMQKRTENELKTNWLLRAKKEQIDANSDSCLKNDREQPAHRSSRFFGKQSQNVMKTRRKVKVSETWVVEKLDGRGGSLRTARPLAVRLCAARRSSGAE
jgi:hypothetical protein